MSGHTPGPWEAHSCDAVPNGEDSGARFWEITAGKVHKSPSKRHAAGYIPCPEVAVAHTLFEAREANARRIVAAVNACAGIPTEALEAGAVRELVEAARAMLPTNICLTNPNIRDRHSIPCDVRMSELHRLAAAIAKATGGER